MENKSTIIKYSVSSVIGLIFVLTYVILNRIFTAPTAKDVFKILTDGFFIPGVLFLGVGGISYVTREGAFDGIGYAFSSIFVTKNWSSRRFKDRETYAQYKERKAGKRTVLAFLLHVGGIMFILSMVCLLIYNLV